MLAWIVEYLLNFIKLKLLSKEAFSEKAATFIEALLFNIEPKDWPKWDEYSNTLGIFLL